MLTGPGADHLYREFPSLSNNAQLPNANATSLWASAGSRNLGGPIQRNQAAPISAQQAQQDDLFASAPSRLSSTQGSFRFGNQGNIGQPSLAQPSTSEEFPPLNRNANGDIGQERGGASLLSSLAFGVQGNGASPSMQNRANNGLLNALSANTRASGVRPPPGALASGMVFPVPISRQPLIVFSNLKESGSSRCLDR